MLVVRFACIVILLPLLEATNLVLPCEMYVIACCADEAETAFPVKPRFEDVCKMFSVHIMKFGSV